MTARFPILTFLAAAGLFFAASVASGADSFDAARFNLWLALGLAFALNPLKLRGKALAAWGLCGLVGALAGLILPAHIAGVWLFAAFLLTGAIFAKTAADNGADKSGGDTLIILAAGFFNLSLITNTAHTDIQYDFASCFNYIEYILENNFLFWNENPLLNRPSYSAYHPILHFLLAAGEIRLAQAAGADMRTAAEAAQVCFCFYMLWYYFLAGRILRLCGLTGSVRRAALAFVCFFPAYNAIAGFFNNDCLLLPLQAGTVYYALLYYHNGGRKNLLWCGIFATAAALTKLSGVLVLPMVATALFLRWRKAGYGRRIWTELAVFAGLLAGGLAIWPLYQHFRLGVGADFVPPQTHLSLAGYGLWERFNPFGAFFYENRYYNDFGINLWETMTKTALFGQWDFSMRGADILPLIAALELFYKLLLAATWGAAAYFVGGFIFGKKMTAETGLMLVLLGGLLAGQILFGLRHPFMCNQDFRYVALTALPIALLTAQLAAALPAGLKRTLTGLMAAFGVAAATVWWRISF